MSAVQGHLSGSLGGWGVQTGPCCLSRASAAAKRLWSHAEGAACSEPAPVGGHARQTAQRSPGPVGKAVWNVFV